MNIKFQPRFQQNIRMGQCLPRQLILKVIKHLGQSCHAIKTQELFGNASGEDDNKGVVSNRKMRTGNNIMLRRCHFYF